MSNNVSINKTSNFDNNKKHNGALNKYVVSFHFNFIRVFFFIFFDKMDSR